MLRLPSDYIIAGVQQTYTDLGALPQEEAADIRSRVISEFTQEYRGVTQLLSWSRGCRTFSSLRIAAKRLMRVR